MKRYGSALLAVLLVTLSCAGLASAQEGLDFFLHPFPEFGVEIPIPTKYVEKGTYSVGIINDQGAFGINFITEQVEALIEFQSAINTGNPTEEDRSTAATLWEKAHKPLLVIERMEEGAPGAEGAVEIGRQDGYVYFVYEPEVDVSDLSESDLALYNGHRELIPMLRENIRLIPIAVAPPSSFTNALPAFTAADLDGNPVTNDIFMDKKVTMINIWGTFCGPCIAEMPDLGEMARNLPDEAQLIGVVIDIMGDYELELAKEIMEKSNADFLNIVPDEALMAYINGTVVAVPTTIFVDAQGMLLGEKIVGASMANYQAALDEYLQ